MPHAPFFIIDHSADLPASRASWAAPMAPPVGVLMCPPDQFDVIDVKNPHMADQIGRVDRDRARRQWNALAKAFEAAGLRVEVVVAAADCEDMVFCANPVFTGVTKDGRPCCVPAQMKHASRRRETPLLQRWFADAGYEIRPIDVPLFEGGGDAVWHPGRRLIWGGYGHRTDAVAYAALSAALDAPVLRLRLLSDRFYHLDTCLCALDEETALINRASFDAAGLELIRSVFARVIECPEDEANDALACNAVAAPSGAVVLPAGAPRAAALLRAAGYRVMEVDTSEFQKSGGSCYCMKMWLW